MGENIVHTYFCLSLMCLPSPYGRIDTQIFIYCAHISCVFVQWKEYPGSWADHHKSLPLLPNHLNKSSTICFHWLRYFALLCLAHRLHHSTCFATIKYPTLEIPALNRCRKIYCENTNTEIRQCHFARDANKNSPFISFFLSHRLPCCVQIVGHWRNT